MGLFRRKADSKAELETMKSELQTMRARLDEADAAKATLAERLTHLDAENQRLVSHVGTVENEVGSVKNHVDTVATSVNRAVSAAASVEAVNSLKSDVARIDELAGRVDELGATVERGGPAEIPEVKGLVGRLEGLSALISQQQQQIADVAIVATDSAERTAAAETAVAAISEPDRTPPRDVDDEVRQHLAQLAEKVAAMDSRINQISVELTNQLTELSSDVDAAASSGSATDADAMIEELERLMSERVDPQLTDITDGQVRLANEQARYAIQFREDLAELAERLRRPYAR